MLLIMVDGNGDDDNSYADSLQSFVSRSSQHAQPTDDCSSCGSITTFSSYHSYESSQGGLTADEESACESTASAFSYEDSPLSRRRPSALRRPPAATTAAARRVSFAEIDDNTSLHSAHSSSEFVKSDLLTVFRAAPLVCLDKKGSPQPIEIPDFEYEKSLLSESLQETEKDGHKINLSFKTATIKQFGTILARGECRVLHLSCHGSKTYLMLDNGHGTAKPLLVDRLKKWITKGENSLQFVFIAACHSRSAGEAFVAAGVPHVVCCQHDNVKLRDTAAIEFASAFYRNLACGRNLDDAFEQGRLEVMNSDSVLNAENEMKKFVLLPQNGQHDQPIFFTESTTSDQSVRKPRSRRRFRQKHNIPHTHQVFLGRNTEIWKVLDNLKISRLVRISGDRGIGKRSLAAAVAQHILRFLPNLVEDIIWLPYNATSNGRRVDHLLSNIFDACNNNEISALEFREKKRTEARAVYDLLHEKKLLLIVDARKLESTEKLCTFLDCLLEETLHVRVIVVHRGDRVVCNNDFPVVESDMEVTPLDISASVKVFGRVCPHRTSSEELKDLEKFFATPSDVPKDIFRMESSSEVCKLLQSGNPYKIRRAAKKISLDQYQELISEIRAPVTTETRVDLDEEFKRLTHQIGKATTHRDFSAIRSIQEKLDRIDRLREARPDIGTLQMMADDVQTDQEYAFSIKDFDSAEQLNEQLESLLSQIDLEKSALRRRGVRGPHHELWNERYPHYGTRAGLEAEIQKQQSLWERASITGISENAHNIVGRIKYLMSRRPKWLTGDQLDSELSRLQQEKREAIGRLNPKTSEQLSLRSKALRKQLKKERLAEEVLRGELSASEQTPPDNSSGQPSLDQSQPRSTPEGSSLVVINEVQNVVCEEKRIPMDPPGSRLPSGSRGLLLQSDWCRTIVSNYIGTNSFGQEDGNNHFLGGSRKDLKLAEDTQPPNAVSSTQHWDIDPGESQSQVPLLESLSGQAFNHCFTRGEMLGSGAFSSVWEVTHKESKRLYAAKDVAITKLDPGAQAALQHEILALKLLRHCPHVIRLYDVIEEPEHTYLIMEKIAGGELFQRIVEKQFYTEREARQVCRVLFEAIDYCHSKQIAHRDLKPENLLLVERGNDTIVKIADFGFAKRVTRRKQLTTACGTPGYVAPEVLNMKNPGHDTRCDMWSIGVIIYVLLGGYMPFQGEVAELIPLILNCDYTFHEEHWSEISEDAKNLIRSLLVVNPDDRPTAFEAMKSTWMSVDGELLAQKDLTKVQTQIQQLSCTFKTGSIAANSSVLFSRITPTDQGFTPTTVPTEEQISLLPNAIALIDQDDSVDSMISSSAKRRNISDGDTRIQLLVEESVQRRLQEVENTRQHLLTSIPFAAEIVPDAGSEETRPVPSRNRFRKLLWRKNVDNKKKRI